MTDLRTMTDLRNDPLFPPPEHDHGACLERILERARAVCSLRGVRLTALRERVLREIASSHGAVGAYDIIERLADDGRRLAPISVYRIIDVLAEAGLVHRLESRNAYFACLGGHDLPEENEGADLHPAPAGRRDHRDLLVALLCNRCGRVAEAPADDGARRAIDALARSAAFTVTGSVLELQGLCSDCAAPRQEDAA